MSNSVLDAAKKLGVDTIRDSIPWNKIEKTKGVYDWSSSTVTWLDQALAKGIDVILTFNSTNPLYDSGYSIYTDAGRTAFANFIVATLQKYPNITAIQIGNEYNTNSFVSGPVKTDSILLRDDYYTSMLKAVDSALDKAHVDIEVIGGSTHSIPVDYFAALKADGALGLMDSVAIHPYTTPPEQFEDQIEVLRGVIGDDMPIRVTEFGSTFDSPAEAPAYMAKMVSVMGAAGIESASWYTLAKEKWYPNMELTNLATGENTAAAATFHAIEDLLASGGKVTHVDTADTNYFYTFGDHAAIVWGRSTSIVLAPGIEAYDLSGKKIAQFDGTISYDTPIILKSASGLVNASTVTFSASSVVADSFDQFDVTNAAGGTSGFEGPWSYFTLTATGTLTPLYTMGGGPKGGEPWTPYIGSTSLRPLEINATTVTPSDFGTTPNSSKKYMIVERYTASESGTFTLRGSYDVADKSTDGIVVHVRINGVEILTQAVNDKSNGYTFELNLPHVALKAGDKVDFIVDSAGSSSGDVTTRHIQIISEAPLAAAPVPAPTPPPAPAPDNAAEQQPASSTDAATPPPAAEPVPPAPVAPAAPEPEVVAPDLPPVAAPVLPPVVAAPSPPTPAAPFVAPVATPAPSPGATFLSTQGNDRFAGTAAIDTVDYSGASGAVTVDLETSSATGHGKDVLTGIENLIGSKASDRLSGNADANVLSGGGGNDRLYGRAGADTLDGGDGNDLLDGGTGADRLVGGLGDDVYYVDDTGDLVVEAPNAGTDTVYASVSYTLTSDVERLVLDGIGAIDGTGNALNNLITGNAASNHLDGGAGDDKLFGLDGNDYLLGGDGDDTLDGGTGVDDMDGGRGNDVYIVDNTGDRVHEAFADGGSDLVKASATFTLGDNIEKLFLTGELSINGTGNALANTIVGNAGDNVLNGGAGRDTLTGGAGRDTFVFDVIETKGNSDTVKDFAHGEDRIGIAVSAFTALAGFGASGSGALDSKAFAYGKAATTADQHLLYDKAAGVLYYDADGSGAGGAVAIATFADKPAIDAHDIFLV